MSVTRFIASFGYVINKSIYYYSYSTEGGGIGAHGMHTFVCMYVCMYERMNGLMLREKLSIYQCNYKILLFFCSRQLRCLPRAGQVTTIVCMYVLCMYVCMYVLCIVTSFVSI